MANIEGNKRQKRKQRITLIVQQHPLGISETEVTAEMGMEPRQRRTVNNYLRELDQHGKVHRKSRK